MSPPTTPVDVVAERECRLLVPGKPPQRFAIRFGRPSRGDRREQGDPWWCPVRFEAPGLDVNRAIAGEDSLQALILALEYASLQAPAEAKKLGGQLEWLDEGERIVLARQALSRATEGAMLSLLANLKMAAAILDAGTVETRAARQQAIDALRALGRIAGVEKAVEKSAPAEKNGGQSRARKARKPAAR